MTATPNADSVRRCGTCGRAKDHSLGNDGKFKVELRPYGPGGTDICHECATATPEAEKQARQAFFALLEANATVSPVGAAMIGQDSGPVPFDPEQFDGSGVAS